MGSPTGVSLPTMLAKGRLMVSSLLETFPDLSLDLLLLPSGGLLRSPTRVSLLTILAKGRLTVSSPLETFPDLSLDLRPPASGQPLSGPLVSPLPPAPTTPSATWPPWSPLATSTPQDTQPGSVPLFALVTLTAKP